jgi:hypothetical protein
MSTATSPRLAILSKLVFIISFVLVLEGMSYFFWESWASKRIPYHEKVDIEATVLGREFNIWRSNLTKPDQELGWTNNTEHKQVAQGGARRDDGPNAGTKISVYGASFVFGEGVTNEETFSAQLARRFDNSVRNFGVGGYGPDQALLRLERHLSAGQRPEIVILGMASESLARIVNIYRKLYIPVESANFVKPVFVVDGDKGRVVNAVPAWPPSVEARKKLIDAAKKDDLWYGQNQLRPQFSFPYLLTTIQAAKFFLFDAIRWQDLYQDQRTLTTMNFVLERFLRLSKEFGFRPFFVIFPNPEDLLRIQAKERAYYLDFEEYVTERYSGRLTVVPVLDEVFDIEKFNVRRFGGHPSAYGHKVIASAIYKKVEPFVPARTVPKEATQ